MIAFELSPDGLRRCQYTGPRRVVETPAPWPGPRAPLSRRERRRLARQGLHGRRGARRIAAREPLFYEPPPTVQQWAHFFAGAAGEVVLYLSDGIEPTAAHVRLLDAAFRHDLAATRL